MKIGDQRRKLNLTELMKEALSSCAGFLIFVLSRPIKAFSNFLIYTYAYTLLASLFCKKTPAMQCSDSKSSGCTCFSVCIFSGGL